MTDPKHTDTSRSGDPVALMHQHPDHCGCEFEEYRHGAGCLTDDDIANGWVETPLYTADRIEALEAEVERLQKQLDRRIVDGIHTCHDECPRLLCVERRENKRLREALEQFFALIEHQYFGSREAMNALQEADNAARAALGEKQ